MQVDAPTQDQAAPIILEKVALKEPQDIPDRLFLGPAGEKHDFGSVIQSVYKNGPLQSYFKHLQSKVGKTIFQSELNPGWPTRHTEHADVWDLVGESRAYFAMRDGRLEGQIVMGLTPFVSGHYMYAIAKVELHYF